MPHNWMSHNKFMRNAACLLPIALALSAADWPGFRGPNNSGIAADGKAPADLTLAKGLAWKTAAPAGLSCPITAGNRVFLTAWEADNRIVLALDATTGKESWRRSYPKIRAEFAMPENGHATPTMVSDQSSVYAFFHDIGLLAFALDGTERWRVPLGPFNSPYGLASSLTAADGVIFLWTDLQDESQLRAFDATSGKLRWTARQQPQSGGGYSTPVIYRPEVGAAQIIVFGAGETAGYQIATGERIWSARGFTAQPASSPIVAGDSLYVASPKEAPMPWSEVAEFDTLKEGRIPIADIPQHIAINVAWKRLLASMEERHGNNDGVLTRAEFDAAAAKVAETGGLLAVSLSGKGGLSSAVRWRVTKTIPYTATPLLYRGVLYTVRNGGILSAYDPADGKIHKQARLPDAAAEYWASPVAGDGRLFLVNSDGKLSVVRAGPQWQPVSATELGEKVLTTPALAAGRLIIRGQNHLFCFGPKAAASSK